MVLDGATLNPGDLSWKLVEVLVEELVVHDRSAPEDVPARLAGADLVLTNKVRLGPAEFDAALALRYVGVLATGYDVIDTAEAARRGITVCNVPAYSTHSVVQWVWGAILGLAHKLDYHAAEVRRGRWLASPDFCFYDDRLIEVAGKTLGIIGLGRIGQAVARVAFAFGMRIIAATRTPRDCGVPVEFASLPEVFAQADIVSLHCPLTPETRGLVNARLLTTMKKGALLINSSRGPLVVEADVADALANGRLAGYAADVLSAEPPRAGSPLIAAPNCLLTPHIAWATAEARQRLMDTTAANIAAFLAGSPQNQVNG